MDDHDHDHGHDHDHDHGHDHHDGHGDGHAARRSPLARWAQRFADVSVHSGGRLALREAPMLSQLNVRAVARPDRPELPAVNAVAEWGGAHVLGLGPDEWLIVSAPDTAGRLEADLLAADPHDSSARWLGAVVDVSAQRTTLVASGPAVRDLLAHGCALDLDPAVFGVGRCAQTMVAHAQVILWHPAPDEFRILVRASFASYLAAWLLDAATELGTPVM
jgi:sarcosine oxidase, subunit gamma